MKLLRILALRGAGWLCTIAMRRGCGPALTKGAKGASNAAICFAQTRHPTKGCRS